jgi:hypothetical protein
MAGEKATGHRLDLPRSQETLRELDRNGVHLALLGRDCRVRWASPALVASRGSGLIGSHCHEALWRREMDCRACGIERVFETGEPHRFWVPSTRPGTVGPRHLVIQVKVSDDEMLEAIVDTGTPDQTFPDIMFRERVLLQGLRHVPVGVLLLDAAMRVVAANPAVLEMLQLGEDAIKGRQLEELLPPDSLPAQGAELGELLAAQSALEEREILLGQGRRRRVVLCSLAAVLGRNRAFAAAVAILTDISRERALNDALKRKVGELTLVQEISQVLARTARLEQVLRVVLAAVVHPGGLSLGTAALFLVEEREGVVRGRLARLRNADVRATGREALGLELESMALGPSSAADRVLETLVKRVEVRLDRSDHPLVAALQRNVPVLVEAGGDADAAEPRLTSIAGPGPVFLAPLLNQGRRLGVLLGAAGPGDPPLDEDRLSLAGLVAATGAGAIERSRLHDELAVRLEDLREAHARLRHLQGQLLREERLGALGDLAAEIVHQIRNPLSVVGGFARRLDRSLPDEDARKGDVAIVLEETQRMEAILERIRHDVRLARIPAKDAVDPEDLVRAAVARYQSLALDEQVLLRAAIEDELPAVQGSRDILLEVLDNLVRNALDAADQGGCVTVRALRLKDAVHLVVEDDGVGLSPEQLERVFEPFFTTKVGGTGLGLPLSRRLVAQCGGTLTADSRVGEGSRFRIVLPLYTGAGRDEEE